MLNETASPTQHVDDESDNDSSDEGLRALTAFFRREVREHRAAREDNWVAQNRFRPSDVPESPKTVDKPSADVTPIVGDHEKRIVSLIRKPNNSLDAQDIPNKGKKKIYRNDIVEEKIDFDNMQQLTSVADHILRPDRPFRRWWDIFMLLLLIYVSTVSVFVFSFIGVLHYTNPLFIIERIVDIICIVDICLNFVTAFEHLGLLVVDQKEIAYNYLVTWFFPDVLSTFPWDVVALGINPNHIGPSIWQWPRYLRLLRVFKLARVARLLRLKRIVTYFEIRFRLKYAYVRSVSLVITVVLISHWTACLFYYFGALSSSEANWSLEPGIPNDLYGRYIASLYFSVYTITTIGYGDVTPTNTIERTFTTICMFFGAACFAFIISQVSNLAQELSSSSVLHRQRMDTLMDLASYRNLDTELVFQIRRYFQRDFLRQRVANENMILDAMSPDLRMNVLKAIYSEKVDKSRLLSSIPKNDLDEVYGQMQGVFVRPNETVYSMHDKSDCMYIILKGEVSVHDLRDGNSLKQTGDVFGESELLFNQRRRGRARCKKYCELVRVPRDAVISVLERHRRVLRELRKKEALQLWAEAIGTAEQQVRYWKMAGELRARAVQKIVIEGRSSELRARLDTIRERSGWTFGDVLPIVSDRAAPFLARGGSSSASAAAETVVDIIDKGKLVDVSKSPDIVQVETIGKIAVSVQSIASRLRRMEYNLEKVMEAFGEGGLTTVPTGDTSVDLDKVKE